MPVINICENGHSTKYDLVTLSDSSRERTRMKWKCPVCRKGILEQSLNAVLA